MCAEDRNSTLDPSLGFAGVGSPILKIGDPSNTLIGITSFRRPCQNNECYPMVFTSVYNYLDWIERIVWPNIQ